MAFPIGPVYAPGALEAKQPRGGLLQGLEAGLDRATKENEFRKQMAIRDEYNAKDDARRQESGLAMEAARAASQRKLAQFNADLKRQQYEGMNKILNEAPIDATVGTPEAPPTFNMNTRGETKRLSNWASDAVSKMGEKPKTRIDIMNDAGSEEEYRRKHPKDWAALVSNEIGQQILNRLPKRTQEPRSVAAWDLIANDPEAAPDDRFRARRLVDAYRRDNIGSKLDEINAGIRSLPVTREDRAAQEAAKVAKEKLKSYQRVLTQNIGTVNRELDDINKEDRAIDSKVKQAEFFLKQYDATDKDGDPKYGPKFNPAPFKSILKEDDGGEYNGFVYDPSQGIFDWRESDDEKKKKMQLDVAWKKYQTEKAAWDERRRQSEETINHSQELKDKVQAKRTLAEQDRQHYMTLREQAALMKPEDVPEDMGARAPEKEPAADPLGIR